MHSVLLMRPRLQSCGKIGVTSVLLLHRRYIEHAGDLDTGDAAGPRAHSAASVAAAEAIKPDASRLGAVVLDAIRRAGADG